MSKAIQKTVALLVALALTATCLLTGLPAGIATVNALSPTTSDNAGDHNYINSSRWANTVKSYLYQDGNHLVRVEYVNGSVVVETYSLDFQLLNAKTLSLELPVWGGFYAGEDANYIICGQQNPQESDATEVIRVVKYDKNFNRLGSAGLYGANTVIPFDAGSLRCDEYGGYLYVRTCHEMYTSDDGLNHQANLTFSVRESDMVVTDSYSIVMNVSRGYVSHSFNQYILIDNQGNIVALDHGDAYPRSAVLIRYNQSAGSDIFTGSCNYINIQEFPGDIGQNDTGAMIGGLAETSTGYLTVFCDNQAGTGDQRRNVFVSYTPKDNFTKEATTVTQLSNYTETGSMALTASNPMVVSTGLDGGYILWNDAVSSGLWGAQLSSNDLYYASYSADGTVSEVQTANDVWLSDCQPIYVNGKVVWYATSRSSTNGMPVFYTLDETGVTAIPIRTMTSISVTNLPNQTSYLEGQSLDPTGLEVTANYDNGSSEVVTGYTLSGYTNTPGQKTITVSYNGFTTTFSVTVNPKSMTSIAVTAQPNKTIYLEGENLDSSGLEVTAYYDNGTSEIITGYTLSGYTSAPGQKTITVSYEGFSDTFAVTVNPKFLTSIAVTSQPDKTTYLEGQSLDTTGLEVTAYYDNNTSEVVTDYTLSGYTSTPGEKTVTVSYGGFTQSFTVTVAPKSLTSIALTGLPEKTTYLEGEELDVTGLEVTAYYNNGTSEVVTNYTLSGYTSTPGQKTITVEYSGYRTSFTVTVNPKSLTSIAVTAQPDQRVYLEGEEFNPAGLEVTAYYNNGTWEKITGYTLSGYTGTPGQKTITVSYEGFSDTFAVTVNPKSLTSIAITSYPGKTSYIEGQELDTTGLTITAYYDNNTSEVVTDYTLSGYTSTPGEKTVTVSYGGFTQSFTVTVAPKSLTSIAVTRQPNRSVYQEGEAFDAAGLEVTAYYNNDTSEPITGYTLSGFDSSVLGEQRITVTYQGFTTSFVVTVRSQTTLPYDFNDDGAEDAMDLMWMAQQILHKTNDLIMDLNQDGQVDVLDVMTLAQILVG